MKADWRDVMKADWRVCRSENWTVDQREGQNYWPETAGTNKREQN